MLRAIASGVVVLLGVQTAAWGQTSGPRAQQVPAFTWAGLYVGAYAGGAWGDSDLRTDAGSVTALSYFDTAANINSVNQNGSGSLGPDAVVGGIQIGGNLQTGNLVYGVEVDFGAFDLNGSRGAANVAYPTFAAASYTVRASLDTDWLLTARARVGWTNNANLLIYATGGLAMTRLSISNSFSDNAPSDGIGGASNTELKTGWTLGGGAEWVLARHWTLKAEYLHVNFGSATVSGSVNCGPAAFAGCTFSSPFSTSVDLSAHIAKLGINYRF